LSAVAGPAAGRGRSAGSGKVFMKKLFTGIGVNVFRIMNGDAEFSS
jgi:hypothetical protein